MSDVLHILRCIGFAELDRVADAAGTTTPDAESDLIDLAVAGLVTRVPGEFGGWGPTAAGRAEDARRTAAEVAAAGARPALLRAYDDFLVLNPELLDLCTAWQLRPAATEARVLDRFADLDRRATPLLAALAAALPRFGRYRVRLDAALTRVRAGRTEHLADSMTSYHAVWFQLHEDLLATLDIPRS